jgi:tetratricopeptide (TPR) repeat protein
MSTMPTDRLNLQRFRNASDPGLQAQVRLEASQIAARQGDLQEARSLLQAAVQAKPDYVDAWLRLAWLAEDHRERKALLHRVLALEPNHPQARAELARLKRSHGSSVADNSGKPGRLRRWILGLLTLAAALFLAAILIWGPVESSLAWLMPTPMPAPSPTPTLAPGQIAAQFVPQLEAASATADWDRALELVAIMQSVDPTGAEVQEWGRTTHMQCGQDLVQDGQMEAALDHFDQALALAPGDQEASLWQRTTRTYLAAQDAFDRGEWDTAIETFAAAQAQMPDYGDVSVRLVAAYRRKGQTALDRGEWDTAIEALLQAHERVPEDAEVTTLLSLSYLGKGQAAIVNKDWTAAIETLVQAHEALPDDGAVVDLLVMAYRQRGIIRWEKGQLKNARADLEAALALSPDDKEAKTYLDKVMYELFPPKRIEIDISKQWFYAWQGDTLVYSFVTSTGLSGRDTATGHYRVLDKIPMAYSSVWRLKMPYWLGIYYVGNIENGIHALPIRPDGSVMWGGLLGQKASYGCIILSTEAARIIYNWADIGTPVDIHY